MTPLYDFRVSNKRLLNMNGKTFAIVEEFKTAEGRTYMYMIQEYMDGKLGEELKFWGTDMVS